MKPRFRAESVVLSEQFSELLLETDEQKLFWKSLMLTDWQSSKRICVTEHFEDEQQMSQSQVGEKTGKVVCRQHTDVI